MLNKTETHWFKMEKRKQALPQGSVLNARLLLRRKLGAEIRDGAGCQACALELASPHLNAPYNLDKHKVVQRRKAELQADTQKLRDGRVLAPSNTVYPNCEDSESKHPPHSKKKVLGKQAVLSFSVPHP